MLIKVNDEVIFKLPTNLFLEFVDQFEELKDKNWAPKIVKEINKLINKRKKNEY